MSRLILVHIGGVGLKLEEDDGALTRVGFVEVSQDDPVPGGVLGEAARQLHEYFEGWRREFDLPLRPLGTPFQLEVWNELRHIPYGETRSYLDIAQAIGRPGSVRAVGAANGANPLAIVVPCHRVIGSDGSLTGFGGGIELKRRLLKLEGALPPDPTDLQRSLFPSA